MMINEKSVLETNVLCCKIYMQKTTFLIPNLLSFQHEMAKQVSETYHNGLRIQFGGKQVRDNRIR